MLAAIGVVVFLLAAGLIVRSGMHRQTHVLLPDRFDAQSPALPATLAAPAILVFSKTNGFRHRDAIAAARSTIQDLAGRHGWAVVATENGAVFNARNLARFAVVIWNNVSGRVLSDEQRAALRDYIEGGGAFIALHAAGDGSHQSWPWYLDEIIRARFTGHPRRPTIRTAVVNVEDQEHPATAHLDAQWIHSDEWYSFAASPRQPGVRILASVDERTYDPQRGAMGDDHPVIWSHDLAGGRVFFSALGHSAQPYEDPDYRQLLEGAIRWAARVDD